MVRRVFFPAASLGPYGERVWRIENEAIPVLDIFHGVAIARDFLLNAQQQPSLQLFVGYILSCLGGTLMTAIMLGQPIGWMSRDLTFFTYAAIYVLAFSRVTRGLFKAIVTAPVISTFITFGDDLAWGNSITNLGVQRVLTPVHSDSPIKNTVCAAIVGGVLSGCGGGMIRTMLGFNNPVWSFTTPRHLHAPHWIMKGSIMFAMVFYYLTNPHGYLGHDGMDVHEAKWIVMLLCVTTNTVWNTIGLNKIINLDALSFDIFSSLPDSVSSSSIAPVVSVTKNKKKSKSIVNSPLSEDSTDSIEFDSPANLKANNVVKRNKSKRTNSRKEK